MLQLSFEEIINLHIFKEETIMLNNTFKKLPDMLSAKDLLEVLPMSRSGIYKMLNTPGFPVIKIGKRKLIPKHEFLVWLSENIDPSYKAFCLSAQAENDTQSNLKS